MSTLANTPFITNPQLELAFDYVRNTHKNIFLTGKAGTGKTTFLHQIKQETLKRMVVVAPTGVAAINAGGMTIHSFFQLPFGPFLPGNAAEAARQRRFSGEKIRLIQSLDLLVIDEISMVRADVLDAIDDVLRRYRDRYRPFGGVQLLMIGDLHQLPPVVKDEEWNLLRDHYETMYFFGSRALRDTQPISIELKHIYRQADITFIDMLNKVRNNRLDADVLAALNSRYQPDFQPTEAEPYIILTSHNASAQGINAEKLAALQSPLQSFKAQVQGDFPAFAYPADEVFECKKGAQVMFVKNDLNRERRYYNGKIGQIVGFSDSFIRVRCPGDPEDIEVLPVEWTNVKYHLDEKTKEVTEDVVGTFTQYPLRLAWAITIHKSQGLTFVRALMDALAAFAHGQVYVALSRCKSFEGIVLRSPLAFSSVKTDGVVKKYSDEAERNAPNDAHLAQSKAEYQQSLLLDLFDFTPTRRHFMRLQRLFLEHENTLHPDGFAQFKTLEKLANEQVLAHAETFVPRLRYYFGEVALPEAHPELPARLQKAGAFFAEKLGKEVLSAARAVPVVTDNQAVRQSVMEALEGLRKEFFIKNACFTALQEGFTPARHLRAKVDAELDFNKVKNAPTPTGPNPFADDLKSLQHPALYDRLKKWRIEVADAHQAMPFQILHNRVLIELVQTLPADLASLKKIKGIGAEKANRFGTDLLGIVDTYCQEHKITPTRLFAPVAEERSPARTDTKRVSLEMFKAGKTIDEIAAERAFVRTTIEGHLAHFVGLGELDIFDVMAQDEVVEIDAFFREHNTQSSLEAKEYFREKYSYGQLKMVLGFMQRASAE